MKNISLQLYDGLKEEIRDSKTKAGVDPIELLAIPCEYPTEIYVKLDGLFSTSPSDIKG